MWGEHVIDFSVAEVEVTELQCCNLVLVFSNYADPLHEVHSDQGVLEISGHAISIYYATQRWNVGG
jgi:hypothetical protein